MTQLSTLNDLPISPYMASPLVDDLTKGLSFFPRLQLCSAATDLGKLGTIPLDHYAIVRGKDNAEDLGSKTVVCIPYSMRMKALDTSGDTPVSYFNPERPEFKAIYERSKVSNSRCMAGLEFLVWIPLVKTWATFYISAPSARPEASVIKSRLQLGCELDSRPMKNAKGQVWRVPVCKPYSSPIEVVPDEARIREQVEKFINEPESELQAAEGEVRER